MIQSYVDVVISGCLEISEEFANDFINMTGNWQHPLLNDRHDPKYIRPMDLQDSFEEIDRVFSDAKLNYIEVE